MPIESLKDFYDRTTQQVIEFDDLSPDTPPVQFITAKPYGSAEQMLKQVPIKIQPKLKDETNVTDHSTAAAIDAADRELDKTLADKKAQAKLEEKLAAIESIGSEPTDTNYVAFTKMFAENGIKYSYAAVRTPDGSWFTTAGGNGTNNYNSWDDLVTWLVKGPIPTKSVTPLYIKPQVADNSL